MKWTSSDAPPPMEYWPEQLTEATLGTYIRRGGPNQRTIVNYPNDRESFDVIAGPFTTLKVAKATWRLIYAQ